MPQPKISVIIPVYNMEKYLKRCMDSIINQTFRELEIILVDDGSKDSSGKLCDEYKALDKRVKVIHKKNAGLGFARNSGIEIATGEYVSFVDSDDYVRTDMYEKLYGRIKKENADTCIFGFQRMIGDKTDYTRTGALKGTFSGKDVFDKVFLNILGSEPSCKEDFLIVWQCSWLSLYSLDIIRKNKLLFPSERVFISEDILFNTDYYIKSNCVTILNEALYYYCLNETSLTRVYKEDRFEKNVIMYNEHLRRLKNYLPDERIFNIAKERVQRSFLLTARYCIMLISEACKYKDAKSKISLICSNNELRKVLKEYPWKKNPFKYSSFNFFLQQKQIRILYILAYVKNYLNRKKHT